MEKDINNGEWGYHFYYEDPHLPEQLCAWLATVCSSGLCIDDLASWLMNVMCWRRRMPFQKKPHAGRVRIALSTGLTSV